ncbi:sugar dehydrogenase complex small subunit [Chryseobacterium sp. CFS15]|uniref:sugar dehydrogenase complex small subunit n=1 Tax=Chryseobacterium sp. CFS15 TaxID=2986946 RepID=UPI002808D384|nr:sugar dehydrogenase complex small subunit [Chryseobacterium sp. CFS15]MDQ8141258.1 sugar dehydrogenase complex small subunit [Chryseobacterium sp. CFS15]
MIIQKIFNVDDYYYDVFMAISESLTGFSVNELQSTGLVETYYTHILHQIESVTFTEFLNISKDILENSTTQNQLNNAISSDILANPATQDIANSIITLWYLGTWEGAYVNDLSYKEGLVWNVMQAHPPGAKQPGFKSWGVKPVNSNS